MYLITTPHKRFLKKKYDFNFEIAPIFFNYSKITFVLLPYLLSYRDLVATIADRIEIRTI